MSFKNYYSILGIDPQANQKEITDAYKVKAKKWHPDANPGVDTTSQMQEIAQAYNVLKDDNLRKAYNISYYRNYFIESQNQPVQKIRIQMCFFCGHNAAIQDFAYKETFYKETNRTSFPQRKVWYETVEVNVPRCEKCYKAHNSDSTTLFFLPLFSFPLLGLILGLTIWDFWFLGLFVGGIVGLIVGAVFNVIDISIIAKEAGIKKVSQIDDFETVVLLKKKGWSTSKPEA